jgi:hypothetical protein
MSMEAMTLVWKYSKQRGTLLLLELALADYANDRNIAWPSINTLARKIRMSRRYTIGMLEKLESSKEIKVIEAGDPTHSNHYLISIKPNRTHGSDAEFTTNHELVDKVVNHSSLGSDIEITGVVKPASLGSEAGITGVVRRGSEGSEAGLTLTTKNHQGTINESLNQPPPTAAAAVVDSPRTLQKLLDLGKVYQKRQEQILKQVGPFPQDQQAAVRMYVGNYLYAITQKGFHKPPSFWASSQLCQGKAAGAPFDELAELSPERLAFILHWSADPFSVALNDDENLAIQWRGSWPKGVDVDKVKQAIAELGLGCFAPAKVAEPEARETTDFDRWMEVVNSLRQNSMHRHLCSAKFINANGAVRIQVADGRIKRAIEEAMPLIAPAVAAVFGEAQLVIETR